MKTIPIELVKARADELQAEVDVIKQELESLKEAKQGKITADDVQSISECKDKLIMYKAGLAELINLLQD